MTVCLGVFVNLLRGNAICYTKKSTMSLGGGRVGGGVLSTFFFINAESIPVIVLVLLINLILPSLYNNFHFL